MFGSSKLTKILSLQCVTWINELVTWKAWCLITSERSIRPWLFVPQAHAGRLKGSLASLGMLPSTRITFLEDVVP